MPVIAAAVGVLVIILIVVLAFLQYQLHLASSDPANNAKNVDPTHDLKFTFSKSVGSANVTLTPTTQGTVTTADNIVTFHPTTSLQASTAYTATVGNLTDMSGHQIKNATISFTTGFVDFNQLPASQQKANTDGIENKYPVTKYLPYSTLDYTITFKTDQNGNISYPVTLNVAPRYAGDPTYIPALQKAQAEVVTWIKSVGADPTKMDIIYNPNPTTGAYTPDSP
jgi:hypothetical protein